MGTTTRQIVVRPLLNLMPNVGSMLLVKHRPIMAETWLLTQSTGRRLRQTSRSSLKEVNSSLLDSPQKINSQCNRVKVKLRPDLHLVSSPPTTDKQKGSTTTNHPLSTVNRLSTL